MESAKNVKNLEKDESEKKCMLCEAGFDAWISTLEFSEERQERMRAHFMKFCPDCKAS